MIEEIMGEIIDSLRTQLATMTQERDGLVAAKWAQDTDAHARLGIAQQQLQELEAANRRLRDTINLPLNDCNRLVEELQSRVTALQQDRDRWKDMAENGSP